MKRKKAFALLVILLLLNIGIFVIDLVFDFSGAVDIILSTLRLVLLMLQVLILLSLRKYDNH